MGEQKPTETPKPKSAEAVGAVAGIASRTSASISKRMKYLFLMMPLQRTREVKLIQRENRFGREGSWELGGPNRL
jgi:hypothetical protein